MRTWSFTSTIVMPDGVRVEATITSPDRTDVLELAEVAQMTASHGAAVRQRILRHDQERAERAERRCGCATCSALRVEPIQAEQ